MMPEDWDRIAALYHTMAYENLAGKPSKIYNEYVTRVNVRQRKPHNNWIERNILEVCRENEGKWKRCRKRLGGIT